MGKIPFSSELEHADISDNVADTNPWIWWTVQLISKWINGITVRKVPNHSLAVSIT